MFKRKIYNIGIALSGGGARGFAHLGILKALAEKGIKPDVISGVSAGAIAGAFISSGKSPEETLEIIKKYRFFELSRLRFPRLGLFTMDNLKSSLEKEIEYKRIEELPIPLMVGATDILEGKMKYFSNGLLTEVILASSSIPVLFNPIKINGKLYSDGGVLENQPIKPLLDLCRKTIVVNISPTKPIKEIKNIVQMTTRLFQLGVNVKDEEYIRKSSLYIEPDHIDDYEFLDTKHAQEIFNIGYDYVSKMDIKL